MSFDDDKCARCSVHWMECSQGFLVALDRESCWHPVVAEVEGDHCFACWQNPNDQDVDCGLLEPESERIANKDERFEIEAKFRQLENISPRTGWMCGSCFDDFIFGLSKE